jgi:hypothetical protein
MGHEKIKEAIDRIIESIGKEFGRIGTPAEEIVILQDVVIAALGSVSVRHKRNMNDLAEEFAVGIINNLYRMHMEADIEKLRMLVSLKNHEALKASEEIEKVKKEAIKKVRR